MLTARYERLGLERGDKMLDLGCGFGRHAFEAARRGADVIALDAGRDEVEGVKNMFAAMVAAGELDAESLHAVAVQGDALHLPFPDAAFDRVICSEVVKSASIANAS
jgi:ubiquinone/menaquinone biosynthesis C-methylase UbiE